MYLIKCRNTHDRYSTTVDITTVPIRRRAIIKMLQKVFKLVIFLRFVLSLQIFLRFVLSLQIFLRFVLSLQIFLRHNPLLNHPLISNGDNSPGGVSPFKQYLNIPGLLDNIRTSIIRRFGAVSLTSRDESAPGLAAVRAPRDVIRPTALLCVYVSTNCYKETPAILCVYVSTNCHKETPALPCVYVSTNCYKETPAIPCVYVSTNCYKETPALPCVYVSTNCYKETPDIPCVYVSTNCYKETPALLCVYVSTNCYKEKSAPYLQMGYANLKQKTAGIHLRQFSRAYVIDDGNSRMAFVSADVGMIPHGIRKQVSYPQADNVSASMLAIRKQIIYLLVR
uniref:Neutral/alkaline non-lysosomal ceramidase N-terminal domain-containing protein n=1 Tax=Timema monikensis TaxID=170555 RepID=A0A7R9E225_9NEOP|nr:unnamed protein product [Timema monikensis]